MKPGDHITIAGCFAMKINPARHWWQVWKPRYVADDERLARFKL
jgi:hypothetical protein